MMTGAYSTRRRWAKGRSVVRLDWRAISIPDGRHVEHVSDEPKEAGEENVLLSYHEVP